MDDMRAMIQDELRQALLLLLFYLLLMLHLLLLFLLSLLFHFFQSTKDLFSYWTQTRRDSLPSMLPLYSRTQDLDESMMAAK